MTARRSGLAIRTSYTDARANLARFCDEAVANREVVIIQRQEGEDVALIAASELASLMETAHLLRSPRNAERLLTALERAKAGQEEPPEGVWKVQRSEAQWAEEVKAPGGGVSG